MTEETNTIPFTSASETQVPSASDIQGADAFYNAMQSVYAGLHELAAPFSDSPEIVRAYGEVVRYLELATMYADRMNFLIRNPELLPKQDEGGADASPTS